MIQVPSDVAGKIISTLRGAPMLVAMLIVNLTTMGLIAYLVFQAAQLRASERGQLLQSLERCFLLLNKQD